MKNKIIYYTNPFVKDIITKIDLNYNIILYIYINEYIVSDCFREINCIDYYYNGGYRPCIFDIKEKKICKFGINDATAKTFLDTSAGNTNSLSFFNLSELNSFMIFLLSELNELDDIFTKRNRNKINGNLIFI